MRHNPAHEINTIKYELIMKNLILQKSVRWLGAAMIALVAGVVSDVTASAATKVETWRFESDSSPATPELVVNTTGSCLATVTPGAFASGWVASSPVFGSANGVWDLGSSGTVSCSGLTVLIGGVGSQRTVTVKVTQYRDGGIYAEPTEVAIAGASIVSSNITHAASGGFGDWVTQETRWQLPPSATADTVQITGAEYGSLVDSVSLESSLAALPPPQLAIRPVGNNQVELTWPAGYSSMILESNGDASNALNWSPVEATVQTSGDVSFVTLDATNAAQFYRLKQP